MPWPSRLLNLLRSAKLTGDLDEEMQFHLESRIRDNRAAGMSASAAREDAIRRFGHRTQLNEKTRDADILTWLETAAKDLWFAARELRRNPGFACAAVLTLALGIGANTAIFSVVKAVLLNQLPYREPGRLVIIASPGPEDQHGVTVDFTTTHDWRMRSRSFEQMALYRMWRTALLTSGEPELVNGLRVNSNFFETLGIKMQLGRAFTPEEDRPDRWHVVILSHSLWVRRFGGDPHIIGTVLHLNEASFTVVGVLPPDFHPLSLFDSSQADPTRDIFAPLGYALGQQDACRSCQHLRLVARLKPHIALGEASAELNSIMRDMVREYPESYNPGVRVTVTPLLDEIVGNRVRAGLWLLSAAVAFVLLIVCANVASLLLARASVRLKEITMRAALGATRIRVIRQLLTESVLLAAVGGVVGIMLAAGGTRLLALLAPQEIPRVAEVRIDLAVLAFAVGASVAAAVLFGLAPALRASRVDLIDALKSSGKATDARARSGFRSALVIAQTALAFVLIVGVGLLGKSFLRLLNVDPGFDSRNVLTLQTYVYSKRYQNPDAELAYYQRAIELLKRNPQVEAAAMTSILPLIDFDTSALQIRERQLANSAEAPYLDRYSVSPDYFRVMRIPLKRGRLFTEHDRKDTQHVALISEACDQSQFPGQDPLGQHIQLGGRHETEPWATIIGIVGDMRQYGLDRLPRPAAYLAQAQNLDFSFALVARTSVDPQRLEDAARTAFITADKTQPVYNVRPLDDYRRASLAERSFTLSLLGLFAALALALASVGIYGVISYSVTAQTREFGIRSALGATRREILLLVGRDGARIITSGLVAGLLASLALNRFMRTLLFGVKPWDVATYLLVTLVLIAAAALATFLPAHRAATVDAAIALRDE